MKKRIMSVHENAPAPPSALPCGLSVFQKLVNSAPDIFCTVDEQGRFQTVSAASQEILGYCPNELAGKRYIDLVVPEDRAKTIAFAEKVISGVNVTNFENSYFRKDGSLVCLLWSARWSIEDNLMYCVAKKAARKKDADQTTHLHEQRMQNAFKLTQLGWWEYDVAGKQFFISEEFRTIFGLPEGSSIVPAADIFNCVHPSDRQQLIQDFEHCTPGTCLTHQYCMVKPSGEVVRLAHYAEVRRNEQERTIKIYGSTRNITNRYYYNQLDTLERKVLEMVTQSVSLHSILETYVKGLETLHEGMICSLLEKQGNKLFLQCAPSLPGTFKEAIAGGVLVGDNIGSCGTASFCKETVVVSDIENDPRWHQWKDLALAHNLRACWSIPVLDAAQNVLATFGMYFSTPKSPSPYEENTIKRVSHILMVVLENYRKEKALELTNQRYEMAAKATSDALWDWDVETNTCFFSEAFSRLFGYDNGTDFLYKNWVDNIHNEDKVDIITSIENAIQDKSTTQWSAEYRFYRQDKSIAYVLDRGFIIRDENGKAKRMVGSLQDITRNKEAEEELERLSLVARQTVNSVVITDAEQNIIWVNDAFTQITEYSFEEAIGKKPATFLQGPNTCLKTKAYLRKCISQKKPFTCEIINYTKSGREYWMEIKGQPIFDEKGEVKQFFAIQTDITERKKAETIIRSSEEKYKTLFCDSPLPKWIVEAGSFRIIDVNDAAIDMFEYSRKEFLKLTVRDLKDDLDAEDIEQQVALKKSKSKNNRHYSKIVKYRKKSGAVLYMDVSSFAIQLPTGLHFISTGKDISEKLLLEQQLMNEKMAAQKRISKAIIQGQEKERSEIGKDLHDNVCQLLTTSKLYIENTRYMPEQKDEFLNKGIELLMRSINEIRILSKQLVSPLSKEGGFENSIIELISHYRSLNIFEIDLQYTVCEEMLDNELKLTVYRILQEQLNNTVKYAQASQVRVEIGTNKDDLIISYEDNGVGFDTSTVKTGIGLKNIRNRADAFRGQVKLFSAIGEGCAMQVSFPMTG